MLCTVSLVYRSQCVIVLYETIIEMRLTNTSMHVNATAKNNTRPPTNLVVLQCGARESQINPPYKSTELMCGLGGVAISLYLGYVLRALCWRRHQKVIPASMYLWKLVLASAPTGYPRNRRSRPLVHVLSNRLIISG